MNKQELREELVKLIESAEYCDQNGNCAECKYDKEIEKYPKMGCRALCTADAIMSKLMEFEKQQIFEADHYWRMWKGLQEEIKYEEKQRKIAEQALRGACCYIDSLGEGCGCCAFIQDDLKCRENCDFLAGSTIFWKNKAQKELAEEINDISSTDGWVNVNDALPPTDNANTRDYAVLVYVPKREGCIQNGMYLGKLREVPADDGSGNFWGVKTEKSDWCLWGWSFFEHPVVTHWKPLPNPPKGEKQEETKQ